uniref:MTM0775 n=1 Tax=Volvox carteri f. nagariensis TaxID=3068 RepID=D9CJ80_VOLCA|nr:MTM0775 [Volvox carteri f. nagariensis]
MTSAVHARIYASLLLLTIASSASSRIGLEDGVPYDVSALPFTGLQAGKCVFILATGQSGSTVLMDALNQLPHYLIRGEQYAAFWNVYESFMNFRWTTNEPSNQGLFNWTAYKYAPLSTIKGLYNREAPHVELPWFNEFPQERIFVAARSYYAALYGFYGGNFVSGFKDSRFVCGKSFSRGRCSELFGGFMHFLQTICLDVKVLLNTRASSSLASNRKLYAMSRDQSEEDFLRDLNETHSLYDSYLSQNSDHAFRVFYEDLYNPSRNTTLAKRLLEFLGEESSTPIRFTRMPAL